MLFKVAFIRTNSAVNDPRVKREVTSLAKHDFHVLLLAWDRESGDSTDNCIGKITTKRLRLKAPIGSPMLVLFFPIFWSWVFINLLIFRPHAIHMCDFDTAPAGILAKIFVPKTKLVYDCFEYYPGMVQKLLNSPSVTLIGSIDKIFAKFSDCVIVPSSERKRLYPYASNFIVVPNVISLFTPATKQKSSNFTIFYGGGLGKEHGIILMIKAVRRLKHVNLILCGKGPLTGVIKKVCNEAQNITYLGILSQKKVLEQMAKAHVTIVFYEPTNLNNIFAASNKLFEAMMFGIPIIANKESAVSKIVTKHECGLVVPYDDIQSLIDAILRLKNDPKLRSKFEANGKIAFRKWYNWNVIELDFINKYSALIKEESYISEIQGNKLCKQ